MEKKILHEADSRIIVLLTVEELRALIAEAVRAEVRALKPGAGLFDVEAAANYLDYSVDWVYKNWKLIGGKKIGGKGLRFDPADLAAWVKSRNRA